MKLSRGLLILCSVFHPALPHAASNDHERSEQSSSDATTTDPHRTGRQCASSHTPLSSHSPDSFSPISPLIDDLPFSVSNATTWLSTSHAHWSPRAGSSLTATEPEEYFHLPIARLSSHGKRQAGQAFVNPDGSVTNDCSTAPLYRLVRGAMTVYWNGTTYYYYTNSGLAWQAFVPNTQPPPNNPSIVTTRFAIGGGGVLFWFNDLFFNGQAAFCSTADGTVYAVFVEQLPTGCLRIALTIFTTSSCAGILATWQPPVSTVISTRSIINIVTNTPPPATVTSTPVPVTTTATATATIQSNVIRAAPSPCGNQGLQYEVVDNPWPLINAQPYTLFDVNYMKNASLAPPRRPAWIYYTAVTTTIGGGFSNMCPNANATKVTFYGSNIPIGCTQHAINHRGYLYVYATGVWTFRIENVDQVVMLWVGPFAQFNWTRLNTNITVLWDNEIPRSGNFPVSLEAGTYLPIRFVYGQAIGYISYNVVLIDPFGNVAMDSFTPNSPYLVQYSCDGTSGPPYQWPFGQEL